VSPIYCNTDDREWAGYRGAVHQSALEAGIFLINADDDDGEAGGEGGDALD
jgi:hypothetical protein